MFSVHGQHCLLTPPSRLRHCTELLASQGSGDLETRGKLPEKCKWAREALHHRRPKLLGEFPGGKVRCSHGQMPRDSRGSRRRNPSTEDPATRSRDVSDSEGLAAAGCPVRHLPDVGRPPRCLPLLHSRAPQGTPPAPPCTAQHSTAGGPGAARGDLTGHSQCCALSFQQPTGNVGENSELEQFCTIL